MTRPGSKIISAAGFVLAFFLIAASIECRASVSLSADTTSVNFGLVSESDLHAGFKELTSSDISYALRLTVIDDSATGWTIKTKAETEYFSSYSGTKPCGDAGWRQNGNSIYTSFSTTDTSVAAGRSDAVIDLDFKMLTGWNDAPGSYGINVVFTIFED